jgi:hypothetical protein
MNIKAAKTAAVLTTAILGATAGIFAVVVVCVTIAMSNPIFGLCLGLGALAVGLFALFYYLEK